MTLLRFIVFSLVLMFGFDARAQVFFSDNFDNGCLSACFANGYNGWNVTQPTANGALANQWYISCAENGMAPTQCGSACIGAGNATLHIGSNAAVLSDMGASYFAGPAFGDAVTDARAESPVINLSTATCAPVLQFNYIENGQFGVDNFTVDYFDGTTWTQLSDPPATPVCASGQGMWQSYAVALPASAIGNANVQIGFHWVNNDDGVGTDPSVAIDSMSVFLPPSPTPSFVISNSPACTGDNLIFTNVFTQAGTAYHWVVSGVGTFNGATPPTISFNNPGTYGISLVATTPCDTVTYTDSVMVNNCTALAANFLMSANNFCQGTCLSFTDVSSGNIATWSWIFFGADSASSNMENPTNICYNAPGTYQVVLNITDNTGLTDSHLDSVVVNPCNVPLHASFNASLTNVCLDSCINFTSNGTGPVTSYAWTFNGAGVLNSNLQNPTGICYNTAGTFDVTLTVYDSLGNFDDTTVTAYITVAPCNSLVADFYSDSSNLCTGNCVQFNDLSSGGTITQWSWTFNGGTPSTSSSQYPLVCYNTNGVYDVSLTVTDANGNTASNTISAYIDVSSCSPAPVVDFIWSQDTVCVGSAVSFQANCATCVSYQWQFIGGSPTTSIAPNPNVTYSTAGTYAVTLIGTDANGLTDTQTIASLITAHNCGVPPTASFTMSADTLCTGGCVTFNNTSTAAAGATYLWVFPGGNPLTSVQQNPGQVCFAAAGTYAAALVVTDSNGSDSTALPIVVQACPVPVALFAASSDSICKNDSIVYTDQSQNATNWNWSFGGGNPSTYNGAAPPAIVYANAGNYTTTLVVSDANGNDSTYSINIHVSGCGAPTAMIGVSDSTICAGSCVQFFDLSDGPPVGWQWSFPGGTPSFSSQQNPPYVCYDSAGTYTVGLVAFNNLGSDSITVQHFITVYAPTPVTINYDTAQIVAGQSVTLVASGASSYAWYPPDGLSDDSVANPVAMPYVTTVYNVVGTDASGCTSSKDVVVSVSPPNRVWVPNSFSPNNDLVNDVLRLYVSGREVDHAEFSVYDRWGTRVFYSDDIGKSWDGTYHGKPCNSDVYVYYYGVKFDDGVTLHGKGDVTLLR